MAASWFPLGEVQLLQQNKNHTDTRGHLHKGSLKLLPDCDPFWEYTRLFWFARSTWAACVCLVERVDMELPLLLGTIATDGRDCKENRINCKLLSITEDK